MLIPSIDLMGGKIVQLVQGEKKALEFDDFEPWLERFAKYPLVQIIDLDAAIGQGDNRALVRSLFRRLPCQVGGGIRTVERAREMLGDGALRVIIGSSLIKDGNIQATFAGGARCPTGCGQTDLCGGFQRRQGRGPGMAAAYGDFRGADDACSRTLVPRLSLHPHRYRRDCCWACRSMWFLNFAA